VVKEGWEMPQRLAARVKLRGGMFAIEKTVIDDWLEIEVGFTALGTTGRTELSGDILLKKPFRISRAFEFMIGVGPSISKAVNGADQSTMMSAAFALDFMLWPAKDIGWFVEPTWTINPTASCSR
jgi:hypothetical protein